MGHMYANPNLFLLPEFDLLVLSRSPSENFQDFQEFFGSNFLNESRNHDAILKPLKLTAE
jgi:hypothetical protein